MKSLCNLAAAALMVALCTANTASALPLVWRADWPDAKPVETLVHRGTDVELQPLWRINKQPADTNGWTFTTYCQTNAVGPWFGPLPGAFFSHTNDVGAAFYNVMVRAETPDGAVNYTAFARLRMLDSPGFAPGVLPLPAQSIDFADVTVFNAPWATPADVAEATAPLAAASNVYTKAETDALIASATPEDYDAVRAQVGTNAADIAALETNKADKTELAGYLPLTGGTMTGPLRVESIESNVYVGQTDSGAELTIGHLRHAPQLVKINCYGAIHILDSATGASLFIVQIPYADGTVALAAPNPTAGHLAALDANGNPVDSGWTAADFVAAAPLAGNTYDFATTQGVMDALAAVIATLGGSVTNKPSAATSGN